MIDWEEKEVEEVNELGRNCINQDGALRHETNVAFTCCRCGFGDDVNMEGFCCDNLQPLDATT